MSRRNVIAISAVRHTGQESPLERALLPWEDAEGFRMLRAAYMKEHAPIGPTETALVDQLVWITQRRQRLVIGERAAHMAALQERLGADHKSAETVRRALVGSGETATKDELPDAIVTRAEANIETGGDADEDEAMTQKAIAILETGDPEAYGEALTALREDTQGWWEDVVSDDEETHPDGKPHADDAYLPYSRSGLQLLRFLRYEALAMMADGRGAISRRPAIRLQAEGESLDPFRMDRILALDERLLRQFEKTLGMLLRLKDLRPRPANSA